MKTNVVDYLEANLKLVASTLGLPWNVRRSSEFDLPDTLRGQDRIIEIARLAGADRYLNPPGGVDLYDQHSFARHGLELAFLPEYKGCYGSMLGRILAEDATELANEIVGSSTQPL
jgi:hypothetical protein